ncbi:hypothetical protein CK222_30895 [Mesorhizobium sp. WSM3866]|uniref:hypothetical protein n=1 Tax=Mesorhizobium sp. WSM3866 TaxID=422271 RepID=UPI000BB0B54F|nr:hypothetical protein [Mesorhizobium sp. WSM3866]PBB39936.1 hypothetical protein CK222_30895 [Mesorhizobium sp. WSM3866]
MHTTKACRITKTARVAAELDEDEKWLSDIASGMEPEDGIVWVYGPGDEETIAYTDFGIGQVQELIAIHRDQTD